MQGVTREFQSHPNASLWPLCAGTMVGEMASRTDCCTGLPVQFQRGSQRVGNYPLQQCCTDPLTGDATVQMRLSGHQVAVQHLTTGSR